MLIVGKTDSFERQYMEKFRLMASQFGEFVNYEHDRGARDIGMHLTQKLTSGKERVSTALIWFQMKGKMKNTLPLSEYDKSSVVKISLDVNHLRYWYLQAMPTYLVLYVESADEFLVLNISNYVRDKWGRDILTLNQSTATIDIPKESKLDYQAFRLILLENDLNEWKKALGSDNKNIGVCYRDYDLIWHIGTADERGVTHEMEFWDWLSKMRGELFIYESTGSDRKTLRHHLQYRMDIDQLEEVYPYIEFFSLREAEEEVWDDDEYAPIKVLENGDVINGVNAANEYVAYDIGMKLNMVGKEMFEWVKFLGEVNLIEITPGKEEFISIAPWHGRSV